MEFQLIWMLMAILCAIFSAMMAKQKNRSSTKWFLVGLTLGPLGLFLAASFPKIEYEFVGLRRTNLLSK